MEAQMTVATQTETVRIQRNPKGDRSNSPRRLAGFMTAGAAAVALVLGAAVPARAGTDKDDLAKALIAALIIGAIVKEANKDDKVMPLPAPVPEPVKRKKKKGTRIPAACAFEFEGHDRTVIVYPESCLIDEGVSRGLPRHCGKNAKIYGEWDRVYSERCLREAGFVLPVY
jgi:hypothetical protein